MSNRPVAIVTGGTRSIGRGISEALAELDFDLVLNYNSNEATANATAAALKSKHPEITCTMVGGDISRPETRAALFAAFDALDGKPQLGVMVHNAGQYVGITSTNSAGLEDLKQREMGHGSTEGTELRHIEYYQAMYGNAFVDLCERAIARMDSTAGGSLIGISSGGCNFTRSVNSSYAFPGSGKCVMEYASRCIAKTAGAKNVNCNVVVPGYTLTESWDKVVEVTNTTVDAVMAKAVPVNVPMKRAAPPREVADVVAFLCSPKGRYITGVSLPVDGGLHLN